MNKEELKEELKAKGKRLLDECFGNMNKNANEDYLNSYWAELFGEELENVRQRAATDQDKLNIPENPMMIMTLGASLEPLVLAIHLVKPEKLFVLYTRSGLLKKLEDSLKKTSCCKANMETNLKAIPIGKNPTSATVFKLLRGKGDFSENENLKELIDILQDAEQRNRVVFDITGAKKTISGGCLLFAAYYDIPVYYMDFGDEPGDYHPDLGRPLPGTCYYTRQMNPITGFCLKDMEAIKGHFDKEHFAVAAELLALTTEKMDNEYFSEDEIGRYQGLREKALIYNDWIDGWWGDVYDSRESLPCVNKKYVEHLSAYPKKVGWTEPIFQTAFYEKRHEFLAYLVLELATLSRALEKKDLNPRTIFLRIYGLEELLVGYMAYFLTKIANNNIIAKVKIKEPNGKSDLTDEKHIELAMGCNYGGLEMLLAGIKTEIKQKLPRPKNRALKLNDKWNLEHPHEVELVYSNNGIDTSIKDVLKVFLNNRELRNKSVHSITPVTEDKSEEIRNAFERLLKLLLNASSPPWFNGASNYNEVKSLLGKDDWFKDETVAPLKWDKL